MSGYGRDESVPYAWRGVRCAFHGLFVGILRNVCWYLEERFVCISLAFATLSQSVSSIIADRQQRNGKPFAAVGADLSRPHI